jgi:hypothetical protein
MRKRVWDSLHILILNFLTTHGGAQVWIWFSTRSPAGGLPAVAEASVQI